MRIPRTTLAVVFGGLICLGVITPLAWLIHYRDWGIGLMLLAPLLVYLLMRIARWLEAWAHAPH